jgi:hypothetical protein
MVLTVSFVLSSVTGFVATVAGGIPPAQLDASTGASGPHDFAVRYRAPFVKGASSVHRIPPHVRDDRERPSSRSGTAGLGR